MNIATLCKLINLQPSVQFRVFTFSESFDFSRVEKQLIEFRDYERMSGALEELREVLGEDREGMKILSCMLYASACLHDVTREKGIDDAVFIDTMCALTAGGGRRGRRAAISSGSARWNTK